MRHCSNEVAVIAETKVKVTTDQERQRVMALALQSSLDDLKQDARLRQREWGTNRRSIVHGRGSWHGIPPCNFSRMTRGFNWCLATVHVPRSVSNPCLISRSVQMYLCTGTHMTRIGGTRPRVTTGSCSIASPLSPARSPITYSCYCTLSRDHCPRPRHRL